MLNKLRTANYLGNFTKAGVVGVRFLAAMVAKTY
jgi:hypothetical protein